MLNLPTFEQFLNESVSSKASNFFKKYFTTADVQIDSYDRISPKTICIMVGLSDPMSREFRSWQMGGRKPSIAKELKSLCDNYGMDFGNDQFRNEFRLSFFSIKNDPSDLINFVDDVILPINPKIAEDLKKEITKI